MSLLNVCLAPSRDFVTANSSRPFSQDATMTITTTITKQAETPFTTGARKSGSDLNFWRSYVAARPCPTEDFFQQIQQYHLSHGSSQATAIAHDVGTGPGNIAARLAAYFDKVVGSDLNESALVAARALIPPTCQGRLSFLSSSAEELANKTPVNAGGHGTTDLITVSECVPLLDLNKALGAFQTALRPGGTLAIYFYGPAVFAEGDSLNECNAAYDRAATGVCKVNQPMKGTPGFPFHNRAAEALISYLDNIALPEKDWESVERVKWNCDFPLIFNSKAGFDFDFEYIDRRGENDVTKEITNRNFWAAEWSIGDIRAYLDSVYPNWAAKASAKQLAEVEEALEQLRDAMGSEKRKVTFPTVLILATKAGASSS